MVGHGGRDVYVEVGDDDFDSVNALLIDVLVYIVFPYVVPVFADAGEQFEHILDDLDEEVLFDLIKFEPFIFEGMVDLDSLF